ncbi:MAG: WGR domain-containing protein [Candidatus Paracaedimonas acanthamoebae]|uniref:WGR domain-containing protein n=1 Tax=Candidatus Paracaedimonas acanthamoebae TaxID=244581 RepID=A0A8J7PTJ5_9PROT|nr:WGR domain-containing protein [Holosporales bacterium]MBN9413589.1 WGR domain-containing protein [Candidatus Paracaedimonas acanthamoebae]OJX02562.1 MAG: hypothetical protein BGO76_06720 [Caedibacter sp. 38-128]
MQAEFYLKAEDKEAKIYRYYNIILLPTLFKDLSLVITYGRTGYKERQRSIQFIDTQLLANKFKEILKSRLKTVKGSGPYYKIVEHHYDSEFKDQIMSRLPLNLFSEC